MILDETYAETAVRAAQIMGLRVAGVDILEGKEGPQILEINSSPGLEGIEKCTQLDIGGAIIDDLTGEPLLPCPAYRILTRQPHLRNGTASQLEYALQRIKLHRQAAEVAINLHARNHPPRMTQLISADQASKLNCHVLGMEIRPIYRNPPTGDVYDDLLRRQRRDVARALKQAFFTFALNRTNVRPQHYYTLGRKSLPQRVWVVDRQLADVSSQFKFLLQAIIVDPCRHHLETVISPHPCCP